MTDFDRYAANYDATLSDALAVSGESKEYFARGRITYLKECLDRLSGVAVVLRSLRPGGRFAFWENNPWNPGTRYVMARLEFDRDAITLTARQARRLLLRFLRRYEPRLSRWPLGAQYQVLCEKPR
jgi:SAM-dependent methyltransferase